MVGAHSPSIESANAATNASKLATVVGLVGSVSWLISHYLTKCGRSV